MTTEPGEAGNGGGEVEGEGKSKLQGAGPIDPATGYWPTWWRKYLNDWRSAQDAKPNDGLVAPVFVEPDWAIEPGATTEVVLDAARRRHQAAEDRIEKSETRAAHLLQTALAMLALSFVAAGFEASRLRSVDAAWPVWVGMLALAGLPILFLALAAVEAVGVDRVGYVQPREPGPAARVVAVEDQRRNLAVQEVLASEFANWTARHKLNEFLQARAWLTRGITLLVASGICAVLLWIVVDEAEPMVVGSDVATTVVTTTPASVPPE